MLVRMAFTIDDLPLYPHLALPSGYSPKSIVERLIASLEKNGLVGVYAMANSWALDVDPSYAHILDDWLEAGHHVGNHTHSHPLLNETSAEDFVHDVSVADEMLAPWMAKAPLRSFRHPLDFWGNTEEKRVKVNAHLDRLSYRSADVTSWFFEWEWDRAWQYLRQTDREGEAQVLESEFVEYAAAQVKHDAMNCKSLFGNDVIGIGLAHPVAFFAEVADRFFARLIAEGVTFVPLGDALDDPSYERSGTIVTDAFQVYQNKVAAADGVSLDAVPPTCEQLIERVFELGAHLRPARRNMLVQNKRLRSV